MLRSRRLSRNRKNSHSQQEPPSVGGLNGSTDWIRRVDFLAKRNLVFAASRDNTVHVYHLDTTGGPCAVFKRHTDRVNDVIHLDNDVAASVGDDKHLFTWHASTARFVSEWEHSAKLISVAKLGKSKIVVGDLSGNLTVLTHQSGSEFQVFHRLHDAHSKWVNDIVVCADLFVTCSNDKTAKVWDTNSLTVRATLLHDNEVKSTDVSDRYIVTACRGPKISVFRNAPDYNMLFNLPLSEKEFEIGQVAFLNENVVAAPARKYFYFISLLTKSVLELKRTKKRVNSFKVLSNRRIAVGGQEGYTAIITPPKSVQGAIDDCVASLYPPPLQAAWRAAQDCQLTLTEACTTIITSENCAASLDEWCAAHDLLMQAVKRGDIPASRDLGNSIAHWHRVLYQHCAKLARGEKCIGFVTAKFRDAENASVIAKGQVESLINTISIRRDMEADNRVLVHAIYQLFLRQAEMDVRLREVLRYQRVQQLTALLNAFIGCIPVGGAIATNVIFGGASILNDMQVCGFVESVLGILKDVSGGFGPDCLLERFLQKTNAVMSVDEWEKVPVAKRKAVEDAASNLGLTVDELRKKLRLVAAMQPVGVDETSSDHVLVEDVTDNLKIEPVTTIEHLSEGIASLSVEDATAGGAGPSGHRAGTITMANEDECELRRWEEKGVSKTVVKPLKRFEAVACFIAFILNYEPVRIETFSRLTETMQEVFEKKRIYGATFVEADEEERKALVAVLMEALADVTDKDAMVLTEMWVTKFIRLASQ